jgi:hypothetical protein
LAGQVFIVNFKNQEMKKIFIALIILLSTQAAVIGQVTIQPGLPAVGLIQKNQLWNVLVVNGSTAAYKCILTISLKDRSTGIDVLTATSGQFDVNAGAKQLNVNLLNPIQYNYVTGGADNRMQGLLPAGTYMACYQLVTVAAGKPETLAEECVQFDAEPLSPPMLIFPADSSLLETLPNQFSWIPPTPEGMFDRLRYELMITEIKEGQKAEEALQVNIPFYNDGALFSNRMNYPASAIAFEKEKWYAWQVTARDDKAYAGKSEVWVFKITKEAKTVTPANDIYLLLQDEVKGTYQISSKNLHIKYFSYSSDDGAKVIFSDEKGNVIKTVPQKIVQGDNYFDFSLTHQFHVGKVYRVTVADKNNKRHTLTFSINTK